MPTIGVCANESRYWYISLIYQSSHIMLLWFSCDMANLYLTLTKDTPYLAREGMVGKFCEFKSSSDLNHAMMYAASYYIEPRYSKPCIYMFVVVNFDYLAQASDIRIERRQVVLLCWMQDSNPGSQTPNRQQTECPLTNRLSYRGSSKKTWIRQPVPMISEHSAHPHCQLAFATGSGDIRLLLLISMLWHRRAIFESKGDKLLSSGI